jgi:uncharacterized protein
MDRDAAIASAVFFPRPDMPYGPNAPDAWDHLFEVEETIRLRLRVFPSIVTAPDILFFHGNGETARDYDPAAEEYRKLPATLWAGEYRGYGPSTGAPSVQTFGQDAHKTLDQVIALRAEQQRRGPLLVMGRSLGSAPAIELAAHRSSDLDGVIIESGFARIVPLLEICGVPAQSLCVTEQWGPRNLEKMGTVSLPLLILHAEQDQIIPIEDAELLHAAARDPDRTFVRIPHAGHNDIQIQAGASYFEHIGRLLTRVRALHAEKSR